MYANARVGNKGRKLILMKTTLFPGYQTPGRVKVAASGMFIMYFTTYLKCQDFMIDEHGRCNFVDMP